MPPQDTQPAAPANDHDHDHHPSAPQESEWTQVKSKSRRNGRPHTRPRAAAELPVTSRTSDLRPVADIAASYRRLRARWEDETCCRQVRDLVADRAAGVRRVSRAVNLGVGTFDPEDASWEAKRSSPLQLMAFLVMVEELEKITGGKIDCVFQDPVFTQSDKDFLASLGHEVVETPAAFDMVDADTFLYGIHLYQGIYTMALKSSLPVIFVGTGWDVWDDLSNTKGLEEMEKMEKTYIKTPFPQDSHSFAFSNTSIYWRPAVEAGTDLSAPENKNKPSVEAENSMPSGEDKGGRSSKLESTTVS
ncbi:hypothetical protein B0J13DRAFT_79851 [Dactylonectria estremocensis]|uniref:SRR1-like domain-containing protein n=1 Tax=Dactylonectria estremocensis TaxID=1079267 RepID=A0A9P9EE80_9HYPO|nr:hypothetical protein B0J13DRAFT_79851 [Dactylonectria estremocensis]